MRSERAFALRDLRPASRAFAELSMAGRAFVEVDLFAVLHRAAPGRRTVPVWANVDVPAGNLLRCRRTAEAVIARTIISCLRKRRTGKDEQQHGRKRGLSRPRHSRPPRPL